MDLQQHSALIDFLGGTNAVAELFDIKPPSVTQWRECGIPRSRLFVLAPIAEKREGTQWTRKSLFPNDWQTLWPELAKPKRSRRTVEQGA